MSVDNIWFTLTIVTLCGAVTSVREYSKEDLLKLREEVREMFTFAYDSYLRHAYPADELRPLSCDGVDTWGSYSLTLVDALDTLAIMGNYTEFNRVVPLVLKRKKYDSDINVSVFETNIRIIGGLLSAHLLSYKTGMELEPGWPCNGPLLRLAEDVAQRLIVAFDTNTGMPYGTVNLHSGVPPGETSITCTAGVGTFIIEFGTLSRLTGDPLYEEVAYNALMALYNHRSSIGLLGNHVDVQTGRWTAQDAGIGGGVDSYFEYLVKGAILLEKPELMSMFTECREAVDRYLRKEDWYVWASMAKGQVTQPIFQSLDAYWPAVLSLIGERDTALRILHNYHSVWRQYGFTPEVYSLATGEASTSRESYPLRPELIESIMYLYRATRDPALLAMGEDILRSIQHSARTSCGYATIKDVRDHRKDDRMESFFLAETTKYLYLLFDTDNFIHNPGASATVLHTSGGECVVDAGGYVFNTEAHPVDPALLRCCHARNGLNLTEVQRMYEILDEEDNIEYRMDEVPSLNNDTQVPRESIFVQVSEILKAEPSRVLNITATYRDRNADLIAPEQSKAEIKDANLKLDMEEIVTHGDRNMDSMTPEQRIIEAIMTGVEEETKKTDTYRDRSPDLIAPDQSKSEIKDPNPALSMGKTIAHRDRNLDLITLDQSRTEVIETDPAENIKKMITNRDRNPDLIAPEQSQSEIKDPNPALSVGKTIAQRDRNLDLITLGQSRTDETNPVQLVKGTVPPRDPNRKSIALEESRTEIKTETRAEYVNIDITGREKAKTLNITDDVKLQAPSASDPTMQRVDIDEVSVPSDNPDLNLRSPRRESRAKEMWKSLPTVLQEFLSSDGGKKTRCSPQRLLERLRRERRYPEHPHAHRYELLLTAAPSFLDRISLAGEFFSRDERA